MNLFCRAWPSLFSLSTKQRWHVKPCREVKVPRQGTVSSKQMIRRIRGDRVEDQKRKYRTGRESRKAILNSHAGECRRGTNDQTEATSTKILAMLATEIILCGFRWLQGFFGVSPARQRVWFRLDPSLSCSSSISMSINQHQLGGPAHE